jgi:2-haloacid dehalogenase
MNSETLLMKRPLIVFDVNETLLDLETVSPIFERIFGEKRAMRLWYANLILYSEALTLARDYAPLTDIGAAVMQMMATAQGISVTESDKRDLTDAFASMPPYPDVPAGLKRLSDAGFRLFTLTGNLPEIQTRQLETGGIAQCFEQRFSVDGVKRHKPAPEAYAYVQSQLGAKPSELLLIACHTWDIIGAVAAGWRGALVKRPENEILSVGPQPEFTGKDLGDIAAQLVKRYGLGEAATLSRSGAPK